jgi:hypothetical protein
MQTREVDQNFLPKISNEQKNYGNDGSKLFSKKDLMNDLDSYLPHEKHDLETTSVKSAKSSVVKNSSHIISGKQVVKEEFVKKSQPQTQILSTHSQRKGIISLEFENDTIFSGSTAPLSFTKNASCRKAVSSNLRTTESRIADVKLNDNLSLTSEETSIYLNTKPFKSKAKTAPSKRVDYAKSRSARKKSLDARSFRKIKAVDDDESKKIQRSFLMDKFEGGSKDSVGDVFGAFHAHDNVDNATVLSDITSLTMVNNNNQLVT